MVKTACCASGHRWQMPDGALAQSDLSEITCPVCGEHAETIVDGTVLHETRQDLPRTASRTSDAMRITGYDVLSEAGRGGMGVVYRVFDHQHNRTVALKTLQRIDAVALQRFKKEFRSLSGFAHPNLVSLYELISDGENWCFTMELIDGVDVLRYIRYGPAEKVYFDPMIADATIELDAAALRAAGRRGLSALQLDRLRKVVGQLASGIAALHSAGILHRDIKPSNVMVTKQGRAVLLDFGLAAELDSGEKHLNSQDNILGTVAYMSPEQADNTTVSQATDWYSLGALLYEALTGRTPFTGTALSVLQAKQTEEPPPPSTFWPSVPRDLDQLCVGLLHRDPTRRATEKDVLRVLRQDEQVIDSPRTPAADVDRLIGRERHLEMLRETYSRVLDGRAASVFVRGASGNGKTALVEHFLDDIRQREDATVLCGRCYERESVPFKAIDSLVDCVVTHLKHLPRADTEALMPRDVQSLIRVFPTVGQIQVAVNLTQRKNDIADQHELNRRAIGALRELLARMGDRCRLVIYLDDLQWGDEDSAAMLSDLLQPPDPPVLLFLGTFRSEDTETSPFLHAFRQIQIQREVPLESIQIEIEPLAWSDAVALAKTLLNRDDAAAQEIGEAIARESAGNPFFVSELVKQLQLDGGVIANSTSEPLVLADMIWSRVQRLPDESQRLLEVVALGGRPLPLDQALRITDVGQSAIGPLRSGNLVRIVGVAASSKIETYHDRVRESVVERVDETTRHEHHLRIAQDYARQSPLDSNQMIARFVASVDVAEHDEDVEILPVWYDVAFHYDSAERSDLAFPYALATAEKARLQFSLDVAEQQYRIAERGLKGHDRAVRYRVAEGLGDVLMLRGKYDEARLRFDHALELDPGSVTRIKAKLGELAFKQGDMEGSIEAFEQALRLLGQSVPQWPGAIGVRLAREGLSQLLHSILPKLFVGRKPLSNVEHRLLAVRLHNRLTYAYWFKRGQYLCLWSHLRGMNVAEKYPATRELAHAYSIHAPVMGLLGFFDRGTDYAKKSLAIYTSLNDLWGQGQAINFHGVVLYAASRFDEGVERCREAVEVLERAGDLWEVNVARVHAAFCLFRLGDLQACAELAERVHLSGVELGDAQASGFSLDVWAQATGGRLPVGVLETELQRPREDVQVRCQLMIAEGVRLLISDHAEEAAKVFEKGQRLAEAAGVKNAYVLPLRAWLASALRRQAEQTADGERETRRALLHRASKVAGQALKVARRFQNDLPHALRECGLIAGLRGDVGLVRKYLDESLAVAERQGARFEHAQTLLARAQCGQRHGWPEAERELTTAQQALRALGADFVLKGT